MEDLKFPEIKTFRQEIEELMNRWAKQEGVELLEGAGIIANMALGIYQDLLLREKSDIQTKNSQDVIEKLKG